MSMTRAVFDSWMQCTVHETGRILPVNIMTEEWIGYEISDGEAPFSVNGDVFRIITLNHTGAAHEFYYD